MIPQPPPGRDPRGDAGQPAWPTPPAPPAQPAPLKPPLPAIALPARRPRRNREELTTREIAVTAADEMAFATLETELGGRKALCAALAAADLNQDEGRILGMLADPENDRISLAKVCLGGGLRMSRMMKLFQVAALAKGQTKAIARVAEKLPDVAAAVMEDAIPREKTCPICDGLTTVQGSPTKDDPNPGPVKCTLCRGKGTIPFEPDYHVREMALRLGGMLEKGSGTKILIANQNTSGGVADSASFDRLMTALDGNLYGEGRARSRGPAPVNGEIIGDP